MKILVNASNTRMGGGVQKSVEFIRASTVDGAGHQFYYVLSKAVARNLESVVEFDDSRMMVAPASPSNPRLGIETRRRIRETERRFEPDVVFSVLGPVYVKFRAPHLMGFAVPWITHPNRHAWNTIRNPLKRLRFAAWCRYVTFWAQFADHWVLETRVAADGLARVLSRPADRFHVIPNVYGGIYESFPVSGLEPLPGTEKKDSRDINVLAFAHWYPHKNLEIVPSVASEIRALDPHRRYRFLLTFDTSLPAWRDIQERARRLQVEDSVVNLGPVLVGDGPRLYGSTDVVFLPTVLETFTATYPEAMACRKPIVTTDLPFARDICGEAALFTAPNDAIQAASKIFEVSSDACLRDALVRKGVERLAHAKTRQEAYEMVLQALERTAQSRNA